MTTPSKFTLNPHATEFNFSSPSVDREKDAKKNVKEKTSQFFPLSSQASTPTVTQQQEKTTSEAVNQTEEKKSYTQMLVPTINENLVKQEKPSTITANSSTQNVSTVKQNKSEESLVRIDLYQQTVTPQLVKNLERKLTRPTYLHIEGIWDEHKFEQNSDALLAKLIATHPCIKKLSIINSQFLAPIKIGPHVQELTVDVTFTNMTSFPDISKATGLRVYKAVGQTFGARQKTQPMKELEFPVGCPIERLHLNDFFRYLPNFDNLIHLKQLILEGCIGNQPCYSFPTNLELEDLQFIQGGRASDSFQKFLQPDFSHLHKLRSLTIGTAFTGNILPIFPTQLKHLYVGCIHALKTFPDISNLCELESLTIEVCHNLTEPPKVPSQIKKLTIRNCPKMQSDSNDFSHITNLQLTLENIAPPTSPKHAPSKPDLSFIQEDDYQSDEESICISSTSSQTPPHLTSAPLPSITSTPSYASLAIASNSSSSNQESQFQQTNPGEKNSPSTTYISPSSQTSPIQRGRGRGAHAQSQRNNSSFSSTATTSNSSSSDHQQTNRGGKNSYSTTNTSQNNQTSPSGRGRGTHAQSQRGSPSSSSGAFRGNHQSRNNKNQNQ